MTAHSQDNNKMNPAKVSRKKIKKLTDLPNIGASIANHLRSIDINTPDDLNGKDPIELYNKLCKKKGKKQDPCVLDVFMSIIDFMGGGEPRVGWDYTEKRKRIYCGK